MKKQIFYPDFIPRIFSTSIDMFILMLTTSPLMNFIQKRFFVWKFKPYIVSHNINISDMNAIYNSFISPDFEQYLTLTNFLSYIGIVFLAQLILVGGYFITFWTKLGWTPGKFITGMKIVDESSLYKINLMQSFKRFLATCLFPISVFFMIFSQKRQSLHDYIAGSVVIKR